MNFHTYVEDRIRNRNRNPNYTTSVQMHLKSTLIDISELLNPDTHAPNNNHSFEHCAAGRIVVVAIEESKRSCGL
jgi:hypothetical protein